MRELLMILALFFIASFVSAETTERPLIEIGPKASLYMNDVYRFGIGLEAVVNPLRNVGFRLNLAEIIFDPTAFYFNREGSLDAFVYLPLRNIQLYIHSGIALKTQETGTGTETRYSIRGGLGLNYPLNSKIHLFVEPGIILKGNGETDVPLQISGGARFRIIN
ncbi:hypothetical protein AMJ74_05740 [candidate division WOR_3 bacterium SM1_77]|jgi:hypothetical protein|uniref:Outer membrane protein beta-barrel domain-containing protein n=1 Tax=candidate division WOR_3 bacterium SM1_77 TaxID=1703778 RepID=A0A0S8JU44_UNCW3|nr:MAG: hypothetical protein AMJ74_05740 [candidate division WOR_3 bacterium SM1_77]